MARLRDISLGGHDEQRVYGKKTNGVPTQQDGRGLASSLCTLCYTLRTNIPTPFYALAGPLANWVPQDLPPALRASADQALSGLGCISNDLPPYPPCYPARRR
jgi:hypothetical protein